MTEEQVNRILSTSDYDIRMNENGKYQIHIEGDSYSFEYMSLLDAMRNVLSLIDNNLISLVQERETIKKKLMVEGFFYEIIDARPDRTHHTTNWSGT